MSQKKTYVISYELVFSEPTFCGGCVTVTKNNITDKNNGVVLFTKTTMELPELKQQPA